MNHASAKKKKKLRLQLKNHRGMMLFALITALLLTVSLVVFSYSWFKPVNEVAQGFEAEINAGIRSEKCTFETYQGTLVTADNWETGGNNSYKSQGYFIDQVAYSSTRIADNAEITIPAATTYVDSETNETVLVPGRVYFCTNIQNNDTVNPSVISLYHHNFPKDLGLAVTYPSNTYFVNDFGTDNGNYPDCWILRNAYVKPKDEADVDGPGLLQVEWFVENFDTENTKSIRVTPQTTGGTTIQWLYLMYN